MSQTSFVAQSILATGPIIVGRDVGSLGPCSELSAGQVRTLLGVLTSAEIAADYAPLSHNHDTRYFTESEIAASVTTATLALTGAVGGVQFTATSNSACALQVAGVSYGFVSNGGLSLPNNGALKWSSTTNWNGAAHMGLYQNASGQMDFRGDGGFRFRNNGNTAHSPIEAGAIGIGIAPTSPLHIEQSFAVVNYAIGPFVAWKNTNNSSSQGHCNFRLDTTHASASTGFVFANGGTPKFDWLVYGSPANKVIRESQNGSATALHLLAGTGLGVGKAPTCRLDVAGDTKISGVTYLGSYTIASLPPAASSARAFATVSNSTPPDLLVQASGGAWRYVHDNSAV